ADEHETAVALRLHDPERRLTHVEAAAQVYVQHGSPLVWRKLVEGERLEDARVAHHCIEATEAIDGGVDDRLATRGGGHRVVRGDGDATSLLDLGDDLVGDAGVCAVTRHAATEVVDHDCRTAPRQVERKQATETPASASDDHHLPREVDHSGSDDIVGGNFGS